MSEQKMRDAFKAAFQKAHWVDHKTYDECIDAGITAALAAPAEPSGNSGEFAAPSGEQVGLTDAELDEIWTKHALSATFDCVHLLRDAIAAHEAKRASCSQTAKKSTCEVGRVDEIDKREHVGGAA